MYISIMAENCKRNICATSVTAYKEGQPPMKITWCYTDTHVNSGGYYKSSHHGILVNGKTVRTPKEFAATGIDKYEKFVVDFRATDRIKYDIGQPKNISINLSSCYSVLPFCAYDVTAPDGDELLLKMKYIAHYRKAIRKYFADHTLQGCIDKNARIEECRYTLQHIFKMSEKECSNIFLEEYRKTRKKGVTL